MYVCRNLSQKKMKIIKKAILILLLFAGVQSCKKESGNPSRPTPAAKKTKVTFSLSGFSQVIKDWPVKTSNTVGDSLFNRGVAYLAYLVYNSSGDLVDTLEQQLGTTNFGIVSSELEPGNYTFVFVGSAWNFHLEEKFKLNTARFYVFREGDYFHKKISLEVGSTPVDKPVLLERINANFQLNITDSVPATAKRFDLISVNDATKLKVDDGKPAELWRIYRHLYFKESDKLKPYSISFNFFHITDSASFVFDVYDDNGFLIASKEVNNIKFEKNKRTVLTGKLFDNMIDLKGFRVAVDSTWRNEKNHFEF
jgi:hypothetical protein